MAQVSIQMCCFNGARHLREAVDSILAQSFTDWELIFWDNCSTDNSAAIIASYQDARIKYHRAPHHTDLGGGRAQSWPLLKGAYIAFLDVDDTWQADKLTRQVKAFDDPEVAIVAGDVMWFNAHHSRLLYDGIYPPEGYVTGALMRRYFLSLPGVMVRRTAAEKTGKGFDSDFSHNADFDLFLRVSSVGKLALVKSHVASWRVDFTSQSWAGRHQFEDEHFKWVECHKNADWIRAERFSFIYFQCVLVAKKIYFSLINRQYKKNPATGLLGFLDIIGWVVFNLLRFSPVRSWASRHHERRIAKWH